MRAVAAARTLRSRRKFSVRETFSMFHWLSCTFATESPFHFMAVTQVSYWPLRFHHGQPPRTFKRPKETVGFEAKRPRHIPLIGLQRNYPI